MPETIDNGRGTEDRAGLRVSEITFRYRNFDLAPLSFGAAGGEVVAIIGPNGAGKSTVLELVSGYRKPLAGKATLDGEDLSAMPIRRRAQRVGLARQDAPLLFSFTVREFVRQGRHAHLGHRLFESPDDEKWVVWAIANTRLDHLAERRITEISGGEFQRAVLARTLAQRPRLVLLDEPTANLDIGYQIEMLRLLGELAQSEHFAVVIVTHELNLASELTEWLILLECGRCLCQGLPEDVLKPELLSRVFRTPVEVDSNPRTGRPRVTWGG